MIQQKSNMGNAEERRAASNEVKGRQKIMNSLRKSKRSIFTVACGRG